MYWDVVLKMCWDICNVIRRPFSGMAERLQGWTWHFVCLKLGCWSVNQTWKIIRDFNFRFENNLMRLQEFYLQIFTLWNLQISNEDKIFGSTLHGVTLFKIRLWVVSFWTPNSSDTPAHLWIRDGHLWPEYQSKSAHFFWNKMQYLNVEHGVKCNYT